VKEMLRQRFMGHKLRYKQPLLAFTATPNQVRQSFTPQISHRFRFLLNHIQCHQFKNTFFFFFLEKKEEEIIKKFKTS
jgi:hypothetical protein